MLRGRYAIPSEANFQRFCSSFLATAEHGFDRELLFTNEEATDWVFRTGIAVPGPGLVPPGTPGAEQAGVVVAYDARGDAYKPIYGMGRHNHENSVAIPGYGHPVVLSGDDTFTTNPAQSQLYSYIADDADAVWDDEGDLYGLVLDNAAINDYYDFPINSAASYSGTFKKIAKADAIGDQTRLETASDALNVFQFVRVEDVAYDRDERERRLRRRQRPRAGRGDRARDLDERPDLEARPRSERSDEGAEPLDPDRGRRRARQGARRDPPAGQPRDDGERACSSRRIPGSSQQFPFGSTDPNATTARIWKHDSRDRSRTASSRRSNQSADEGPTDVDAATTRGNLGAWESSGIIDASEVFGPGAFLVDVQAGTLAIDEEVRGNADLPA